MTWPQPSHPDVFVTSEGRYACQDCKAELRATGRMACRRRDRARRGVFQCPECEGQYAVG